MPISLTISGRRIELIPNDGFEVWDNIIIEKCHRDENGLQISLRKSLLDIALKRNVKYLNIKVPEFNLEFAISPQEFITKSRLDWMPAEKSKFHIPFQIYYFQIWDLIKK